MPDYDPRYVGLGRLMEAYRNIAERVGGRQGQKYRRNVDIAEILRDSVEQDGRGRLDLQIDEVIGRLETKGVTKGISRGAVGEGLRTVKADLTQMLQGTT